ncbi:MAG: gliding motility-associated C-terminal domain-containing protein [Vicingaceae bacterium]
MSRISILSIFFLSLYAFVVQGHEGGAYKNNSYPFVYNKGQWPKAVNFRAEIDGAYLYLENNALHYQFVHIPDHHAGNVPAEDDTLIKGHVFNARFVGANQSPAISQEGESNYYYNYFKGNDKSKWQSEVHSYQKVKYSQLYEGIDLVLYGHQNTLKYDYHLSPGADVNQIKVIYEGVEKPRIKDGELLIEHSIGQLIESKPYAYQIINGEEREVPCRYKFNKAGEVYFSFPEGYDRTKELVIDPDLIFSTYSGSTTTNFGATATYDADSNGYMGGTSFADGYQITTGAYETSFQDGDVDIAISKFNSTGAALIYSTYLGGSESDIITSMVVDNQGKLIILGATSSLDYPTTTTAYDNINDSISSTINLGNGYGATFVGACDIAITKFNANGTALDGSTFLGEDGYDGLNYNPNTPASYNDTLHYNYGDHFRGEVIVDNLNNIYIGSSTSSPNLSNASNTFQGKQDGLVAKFNPDLSQLNWLRYHGGVGLDAIYSLKVISGNRVLIGGGTSSSINFPTTTPSYLDTLQGGRCDGYISIISADGSQVEQSTFIGTDEYDQVYFVEFDRFGGIYALGQTLGGAKFPLKNTSISNPAGQFVVKLDPNLDSLVYSHTFGETNSSGRINISPTAFLVDRCQNIYVSGWGGIVAGDGRKFMNNSMPIANNPPPAQSITDGSDFYIYAANRDLDSVLFATFLGDQSSTGGISRDHVDGGTSRFDRKGVIYQSVCASCGTGRTGSGFPTTPNSAFPNKNITTILSSNPSACNNVLFKYNLDILPSAKIDINKQRGCSPYLSTITDSSARSDEILWLLDGDTLNIRPGGDTTVLFDTPGNYTLAQIVRDTICDFADTAYEFIEVYPNPINIQLLDDTITCNQDTIDLTIFSNNTASEFYWSSNPRFSDTLNNTVDSTISVEPKLATQTFYIIVTDTANNTCEYRDSVSVTYVPFQIVASVNADTVCIGSDFLLSSTSTNVDQFEWNFGNGQTNTTDQNISISYATPGDYKVKITATNNTCQVTDADSLLLNVQPNNLSINSLPDSIYCGTDTLNFAINSQGTSQLYLWSNQPDFSDTLNNYPLDSNIKVFSSVSDTFYFQVSDRFCEVDEKFYLEYYPFELNLTSAIPDSGCAPFDVQLNTELNGITSFEIRYGNGNSTTTEQDPLISYSNPGRYYIEIVGTNSQCNLSETLIDSVEVLPDVSLQSISDTMICAGDTIQLSGNSQGSASQFVWDTLPNFSTPLGLLNDSTVEVSPDVDTRFYLKGINAICEDEINLQVRIEDLEIDVDDLQSICIGDTISFQAVPISFLNPLSYQWQPVDSIISGANTTTITTAPKGDVTFDLLTTSSIGCEERSTATLDVELPAFTEAEVFAVKDSIFNGEGTQLSTDRNGSNLLYEWEPAELVDNPTSANPNVNPTQTTIFKVTITDLNTGCEVEAFKRVKVFEINCDKPDIFIPTAFTPNGDGQNDLLLVRGANLDEIDFSIYNRWGELIFNTTNKNEGWDGTYQGKEVDPAVFVYHLKATCLDGQEFYDQGNITLIR